MLALALQLIPLAPQLFRWLNGDNPAPIAQKVIEVAQAVTQTKNPEDAVKAILGDPAQQAAFKLALQDKSDEMERAFLADRADARRRDAEFIKTNRRNERADNLAYLAVCSLVFTICALFTIQDISPTSEKLLYLVLGALIVIVKDVYGFEFGSSKDSARNTQALIETLGNGQP